jgi:hypothetical protein
MKKLFGFRRRSFPNHLSYPRLLLFHIPNRHPRSRVLLSEIHEYQMPAGRSRRRPCARQHSNTTECRTSVNFWQRSLPTLVCSIQSSDGHAHLYKEAVYYPKMWRGSVNASKRVRNQTTESSSQSKNSAYRIQGFDQPGSCPSKERTGIGRLCSAAITAMALIISAGIAVAVSRCPRESFNNEDDHI